MYMRSKTNKLSFMDEIGLFIMVIARNEDIIILGDMNIYLLSLSDQVTRYKDCLCDPGLQCLIPAFETTRGAIVADATEVSCIDLVWVRSRHM